MHVIYKIEPPTSMYDVYTKSIVEVLVYLYNKFRKNSAFIVLLLVYPKCSVRRSKISLFILSRYYIYVPLLMLYS